MMKNADTDAKKMASLQTEQRGGADDDVSDDVLDDVEAAKLFRHFSVDKTADKNILMSALSALLGPGKPGSGNGRCQHDPILGGQERELRVEGERGCVG